MAEDESAERELRFVNLLQPNRDMATNWSVDVGKQLEGYLDELKATGLFDDGASPLNFAEGQYLDLLHLARLFCSSAVVSA
jgi:hypothetical protein